MSNLEMLEKLTLGKDLTEECIINVNGEEVPVELRPLTSGEVGALEPSSCKLLQLPLEVNIAHCEDSDISCKILFPKCTVKVEYSMSGVDTVEATMTLESLGSGNVTLADTTTEVETDMYVKLVNYVEELAIPSP